LHGVWGAIFVDGQSGRGGAPASLSGTSRKGYGSKNLALPDGATEEPGEGEEGGEFITPLLEGKGGKEPTISTFQTGRKKEAVLTFTQKDQASSKFSPDSPFFWCRRGFGH